MNSKNGFQQSARKERARDATFMALLVFLLCFPVRAVHAQAAQSPSYRLVGTIISKDFTGIVLDDKTGEQSFYRLYDTLPDGSRVVQVRSDSVVLKGTDNTLYEMYVMSNVKTAPANSAVRAVPAAPETAAQKTSVPQQVPREPRRAGRHRSGDEQEQ